MSFKIQVRRGTTSEWTTANPVLSSGELGYDTQLKIFKIGDGTTAWNSLATADKDQQTAAEVVYNNETSGLSAASVQAAIDELTSTLTSGFDNLDLSTIGGDGLLYDAQNEVYNVVYADNSEAIAGESTTKVITPATLAVALAESGGGSANVANYEVIINADDVWEQPTLSELINNKDTNPPRDIDTDPIQFASGSYRFWAKSPNSQSIILAADKPEGFGVNLTLWKNTENTWVNVNEFTALTNSFISDLLDAQEIVFNDDGTRFILCGHKGQGEVSDDFHVEVFDIIDDQIVRLNNAFDVMLPGGIEAYRAYFRDNGNYIGVAHWGGNNVSVWKWNGTQYIKLPNLQGRSSSTFISQGILSPDVKDVLLLDQGSLHLYKEVNGIYTFLGDSFAMPGFPEDRDAMTMIFSPDSQYLFLNADSAILDEPTTTTVVLKRSGNTYVNFTSHFLEMINVESFPLLDMIFTLDKKYALYAESASSYGFLQYDPENLTFTKIEILDNVLPKNLLVGAIGSSLRWNTPLVFSQTTLDTFFVNNNEIYNILFKNTPLNPLKTALNSNFLYQHKETTNLVVTSEDENTKALNIDKVIEKTDADTLNIVDSFSFSDSLPTANWDFLLGLSLESTVHNIKADATHAYVLVEAVNEEETWYPLIKIQTSDMSVDFDPSDKGDLVFDNLKLALALDDDYLYIAGVEAGGYIARGIEKYDKATLELITDSDVYGSIIRDLAVDDDRIYAAGGDFELLSHPVMIFDKEDLSLVGQTLDYAGIINTIAVDDTFIYAAGYDAEDAAQSKILQYNKVTFELVLESAAFGEAIEKLVIDENFIFAHGDTGLAKQYDKVTLELIDTSSIEGKSIEVDEEYAYIFDEFGVVYKYSKADLSYLLNKSVPGLLAEDDPIVDLELDGVSKNRAVLRQDAWSNIYRVDTAADEVTFFAADDPTFPNNTKVKLKVVK